MRPEPLFLPVSTPQQPRLLLLTVGYGQGHNAAAAAMAEEFSARGWECRTVDPCAAAHGTLFTLTQRYYAYCVRRAPQLWGVTYALADSADWSRSAYSPLLRGITRHIENLLREWQPQLVLCTYPLFAHMLDAIAARRGRPQRYAMVVTDAIAVSRPWMTSHCPLVFVTDRRTQQLVCERYGLSEERVPALGFPVRRAFTPAAQLQPPTAATLRILFTCYISRRRCLGQVEALLKHFPAARITVLAGRFDTLFRRHFAAEVRAGRLTVLHHSDAMAELMQQHHLYIGKAGAATLFECYATRTPALINYALPGQEQGNLERLERDGAGCYAASSAELTAAVEALLTDGARLWNTRRRAMQHAGYDHAAARMADCIENRFFTA